MNRLVASVASVAVVAGLAACHTSSSSAAAAATPHTALATHTAAPVAVAPTTASPACPAGYKQSAGGCYNPTPSTPPPTTAAPVAPTVSACTTQLQQWLAGPTGGVATGDTVGQVIGAAMNDANDVNQYSDPTSIETGATQFFLNGLGTEVGFLSDVPNMPGCADTGGVYPTWVNDATTLSDDLPGDTSSDYQTLQNDWSTLQSEVTVNGGTITGYQGSS